MIRWLPTTVMPMLIGREWTLAMTHVAMPLSLLCYFQLNRWILFIVQWIEWCISGVTLTPLTRSALFLDFTISAACTMRGINKLYLVLKGTVACSGIIGRTTIVLAWSGDWMNHESDHGSAFFLPSSGLCKGTSNSWHNCTDPILLWLRMLLWNIQPNVITWLTWV